ncbi:MAG: hypothetical protein ACI822_002925 [Gammaproteobacteria bacterium]|jgi:hypothetical protein
MLFKVTEVRMISQTISLFRYLLLGFLNRRLLLFMVTPALLALTIGALVSELAIINAGAVAAGLVADVMRYSLVLMMILLVSTAVAEDFEFRQFERLLTMPLARWQYVVAQSWVVAVIALLLAIPCLIMVTLFSDWALGLYWATALWLELLLIGLLALLAALSLEKVTSSVLLTLACYLLAKLSGLISRMLAESVSLSSGSITSRFGDAIFSGILYVIPDIDSFANNNVFFAQLDLIAMLLNQFYSVLIYALFLLVISLVDFYRKEFNF